MAAATRLSSPLLRLAARPRRAGKAVQKIVPVKLVAGIATWKRASVEESFDVVMMVRVMTGSVPVVVIRGLMKGKNVIATT